jgi:hypothetical protein
LGPDRWWKLGSGDEDEGQDVSDLESVVKRTADQGTLTLYRTYSVTLFFVCLYITTINSIMVDQFFCSDNSGNLSLDILLLKKQTDLIVQISF